jgi:hypothetical protein
VLFVDDAGIGGGEDDWAWLGTRRAVADTGSTPSGMGTFAGIGGGEDDWGTRGAVDAGSTPSGMGASAGDSFRAEDSSCSTAPGPATMELLVSPEGWFSLNTRRETGETGRRLSASANTDFGDSLLSIIKCC